MRAISRRELNRNSAAILDSVLATGEPVEVRTKGRGSVVIARKPDAGVYERWLAEGLVRLGNGTSLADVRSLASTRSVSDMLADVESDH